MSLAMKTAQYTNPAVPGFSPDPSIVFVDGIFYLSTSSFHIFPGLPIYASRDLKSWIQIGNAINRPEQLSLNRATMMKVPLDTGHFMVGAGGLFAPTIRYHSGKFYIICTNCAEVNGSLELQNFIVSSTDIWAGDWSDLVNVDFNGIDPSLFFEDDGRVYFQGCYTINRMKQPSCTIKQFEIDVQTGEHLSDEREIWGGHARYDTEGPHIYKVGKWYYLLVAEGGTFEHHMLCISRAESIWGPYEDFQGNPILTADGTDEYIQNLGHGELFQDGQGKWWAVGLGVRNENEGEPLGKGNFVAPLGRETFLTSVEWPEDGWPRVLQPQMKFVAKAIEIPAGVPDFVVSQKVGNVHIRTPDLSKYSISEDEAEPLILYPSNSNLSTPTRTSTFVGRRQRSMNAVATASLDISKMPLGVVAGLALYKDHLRHISISYDSETRKVSCHAVTLEMHDILLGQVSVYPQRQQIKFKVESNSNKLAFSVVASNIEEWTEIGSLETWKIAAREMTGPIMGIFAFSTSEGSDIEPVKFSGFHVSDTRTM